MTIAHFCRYGKKERKSQQSNPERGGSANTTSSENVLVKLSEWSWALQHTMAAHGFDVLSRLLEGE